MQKLTFDKKGNLKLAFKNSEVINESPVGRIIKDGKIQTPNKAEINKDEIKLIYDAGTVLLKTEDKNDYLKLTVADIDKAIDVFIFGPYKTDFKLYGEMIGIAHDGNITACIQSLNPKTMGGFPEEYKSLHPYDGKFTYPLQWAHQYLHKIAAAPTDSGTVLQCYVRDMSRHRKFDYLGFKNAEVNVLVGIEASVVGASIALFACEFDKLLDNISNIEVLEGLPHPLIDGEWAKTSPKAAESYLNIRYTKETFDKALEWTKRTGLTCLYSGNPFVSWGHFKINESLTVEGDEGFRKMVKKAADNGINMGFHTLSNFVNTYDEYVSPVPHKNLLIMDTTELVADIGEDDEEILVADENNFATPSTMNSIRIEDELIRYKEMVKRDGKIILTCCKRGAFETVVAEHKAGCKVHRMWEHGYKTLFPDVHLQNEMAQRLGELAKHAGIKRMSFDGLEGCEYYGLDEYGCSEYVRRCYESWGPEVLSDASTFSHYRWHAHTYLNHGEPHYESSNRSGMVLSRAENQNFYARNLMPHMLGQYNIKPSQVRVEATSPENFEFCMSQSIAYDAGLTLYFGEKACEDHGMAEDFLDVLRIWNDMRINGDIPQSLRDEMKDINGNWQLEETDYGWLVNKLYIRDQQMPYLFCTVGDEGDFMITDNSPEYEKTGEFLLIDSPHIKHNLRFRVRVGCPNEKGTLSNLEIYPSWKPDRNCIVNFSVTANAGEYLIYNGGMQLERRDADYRLIEIVEGKGRPITVGPSKVEAMYIFYTLSDDADLSLKTRLFQIMEQTKVLRK